jgi:hypothetical protein
MMRCLMLKFLVVPIVFPDVGGMLGSANKTNKALSP